MKKHLYMALAAVAIALAGFTVGFTASGDIWAVHPGGSSRNTAVVYVPQAGTSFLPGSDNAISLGSSALNFSDVRTYDMTLSDDLTVGDDLSVTDALAVTGASTLQRVTFGLQLSTAPRTSVTYVNNSTGTLVFNSTSLTLCYSTGSLQTSLVVATAPTTACPS